VRVPPTLQQVTLTDPAGRESQLDARNGLAIVPHPNDPGFYVVSYQGDQAGSSLSVVNLTSPVESDLRGPAPGSLTAGATPPSVSRAGIVEPAEDWGFLAAAVALGALLLQVWWLTRRPAQVESARIQPLRPERRGVL
jgi:hypothetical protein